MMPSKGDRVRYLAVAGCYYDAIVTGVRDGGFVDVEVIVPGSEDRVALSAVRFAEREEPWAQAWPKEGA